MGSKRKSLPIGESCLLVGRVHCGYIRRDAARRFFASDRAGRALGVFGTLRAAEAAILASNLKAAEAVRFARPIPSAPRPKMRLRRRAGASIRIAIGEAVKLEGQAYSGTVEHAGRRRFLSVSPQGEPLGSFTSLRRALDAIRRPRAKRGGRKRASSR